MKRYWLLFLGIIVILLAAYGLAVSLGLDIESFWESMSEVSPWLLALLAIIILVLDVLLPVPSSILMLGIGHIFGGLAGALICLLGTVLACLFAFAIGRIARGRVERWVGVDERRRADQMLDRWGVVALILSRPLPLVAEAVALMAGASEMSWKRAFVGSCIGCLPISVLYATTGAGLGEYDDGLLLFGLVVVLGGMSWFIGRRLEEKIDG